MNIYSIDKMIELLGCIKEEFTKKETEIYDRDKIIADLKNQLDLASQVIHSHYHYDKPCTLPHTHGYNIGIGGVPINWTSQWNVQTQQANQQTGAAGLQCDAIGK